MPRRGRASWRSNVKRTVSPTVCPNILIEAKRIAQTVAHGIHGRRRAGPGETFWQFRQFQSSDTARQIDWRRSASSDHLYVREREWEAAHTVVAVARPLAPRWISAAISRR